MIGLMVLSAFSHLMSLDRDTSIKSAHSESHNIPVGEDQYCVSASVKGNNIVSEQRSSISELVCKNTISTKSEIGSGTPNIGSEKNNSSKNTTREQLNYLNYYFVTSKVLVIKIRKMIKQQKQNWN